MSERPDNCEKIIKFLSLTQLDDDEKYLGILSSQRNFNAVKIVNLRHPSTHMIERVQNIFQKYQSDIKSIEFSSCTMRDYEFVSVLDVLPDVIELSLIDMEFSETDNPIIDSKTLRHISSIKFHLCNVKSPKAILPNISKNVIKNLIIETCIVDQKTLSTIFERQHEIQALEFDPYYVNSESLEHLKLRKLKLMCNRHVKDILKNQSRVASLDLSRAHIGDEEFHRVCELRHLEKLRLWIDRISWENLENLSRLKVITELSLNYDRLEVEYARILTNIQLLSLRKLRLKFPRLKISEECLVAMAQNMPNIQEFQLSNQSIGIVCAVLKNFQNLETFIVGCDSDSCEVVEFPIEAVDVEKFSHLKLRNLCIFNRFDDQKMFKCQKSLFEVIRSLKNLKKLKLDNVNLNISEEIPHILRKITHFSCSINTKNKVCENIFNEKFVELLQQVKGQRLQYFHLNGFEIFIHKSQLELDFREQFEMISIKPWRRQITMRNCKWEHGGSDD